VPNLGLSPIYTSGVLPSLKTLDWSGFLARPKLPPPAPHLLEGLRRTPVLIAGAGGSIGSALAFRLAAVTPELVLLEASESNLFALRREIENAGMARRARFKLGSVSDRGLVEEIVATHAPGLVFHAAAFKHVPLLEGQPFAAIENNVSGTAVLTGAASGARVVLLSTDKAAGPASIMGATKRVAEQIVMAADGVALRLGNVLASRDSVAEVFAGQIAAGEALTVTEAAAQRYFITVDEAVDLLLAAATEPHCAALFAPALSAPHRIVDLARYMAKTLAPGRDVPLQFTGLRPGDKREEQFWATTETVHPATSSSLLRIDPKLASGDGLQRELAHLQAALEARDLNAAMASLCRLVPDYTPSAALKSLAGERRPRVMV
jgi:FlaA1/EpsC-like NDP-sugar epimerase